MYNLHDSANALAGPFTCFACVILRTLTDTKY